MDGKETGKIFMVLGGVFMLVKVFCFPDTGNFSPFWWGGIGCFLFGILISTIAEKK